MLICTGLFAQSKSDRLFETFRNKPGVTYFAFTKNIADAFNIDLDDEGKSITGDLHEIRFMSYNPVKGNINGPEFMERATGLLPSAYAKVVEKDHENNAQIWMLGNKRKASEFHVFIQNKSEEGSQFLVSFFGNFNIDDMDKVREIGLSMSNGNSK
jgi:hypothetical protein